jgi:hypothetical protein
MRLTKQKLYKLIKETMYENEQNALGQVQAMVDGNKWLKGTQVNEGDLIPISDKVLLYASEEGMKHIKDRHQDANAPGSLIYPNVNIKELILAIMKTPPNSTGRGMVKWEGISSPGGPVGQMGLAAAAPEKVAELQDYKMPGGRGEVVKVAPGKRKETKEVTLVTSNIGSLEDGRMVLSLVTLYPGGMDVDGVQVPFDRGAFAAAGIYFVLPPGSPILKGA